MLDNSVVSAQRLLRSRLGRRLLILFAACAVVPTCAVALLSFVSVTGELTRQGRQRLSALAGSAGKTVYDRLSFFESDLRRQGDALLACAQQPRRAAASGCGEDLLYAAEGIAASSRGPIGILAGRRGSVDPLSGLQLPVLSPGQSTLLVRPAEPAPALYLVHRPETSSETLLFARLSPDYLWSAADAQGLPGSITLDLLDADYASVLGASKALAGLSHAVSRAVGQGAVGSFEWNDSRPLLSAYWTLPRTTGFSAPLWRVVLSEPRADIIAPIAGFRRSFPLVLALALLAVVALSLRQIQRSLLPLDELGKGTRRITQGDFRTPVRVSSGDELEELGGAFNVMTARLERQFRALETAAEIDRAILSSVDTATIAQTVLDRVPELASCEALSLTVLSPDGEPAGTTWIELACGRGLRSMVQVQLTAAEILQTQEQPEWMSFGTGIAAIPGYLGHFENGLDVALLCCPLYHGGELLGVLAVRDDPTRRSNETLLDLRRLADRVAVALWNARMMDQVRVLAFYDSLTRLPNRVLYKQRLGQAIGRAQEDGRRVGVCSLDLDHFSRINDTLGHGLGDQLLQEVAVRMQACFRQDDGADAGAETLGVQVARLGGDEFAVVLPALAEPQEALWSARRMLEAFQQPFRLGSQEVFVTASIGIATYPDDGPDTETVHKNADVAMTHAKEEGRNTVELYSASMNSEALSRMQLEQELRKAVELGEFSLWYQPIVELRTRWVTGAEALIRWEHPERGVVPPGEFIRLCEDSGLIVPLGEWILRGVCAQIRAWERAGYDTPRVSVNLSARQLRQRGIVRTVQDILAETGVRPGALAIELTESLLMEPGGTTERRIRELAELGVSLAIDDFGTGYSSLSYLKNFPVSTLKIDRSFIVDVTSSADAAAITTAIIALARAMELDVVAEGVETKAQASFLRERGCQKAQGYLYGRPVPPQEFTQYLEARPRQRASA
ncbi:MAG TPA: EAL domain-containing protein [Gemmatimonadales bacterium]|jgi:diguanylate cyclase (GGDEF)-like protein|nr:EAL domain-containing protein [Gemmatimonadales bacterium]